MKYFVHLKSEAQWHGSEVQISENHKSVGWGGTPEIFPLTSHLWQDFLQLADSLLGLCLAKTWKPLRMETPLWAANASAAPPPNEYSARSELSGCNTAASPHLLPLPRHSQPHHLGSHPLHNCRQLLNCTLQSTLQTKQGQFPQLLHVP